MEVNEVLDGLRLVRNLANASKTGLRASGDEQSAAFWEQGANAAEEAIKIIQTFDNLKAAFAILLDRK